MKCIFLTNDLIFSSRVSSAAGNQGAALKVVGSQAALLEEASQEDTALVVLDLTSAGLQTDVCVADLRKLASPPKIVAYAPHVMEGKLVAARDAGCDEVLTRGQFDQRIATLFG